MFIFLHILFCPSYYNIQMRNFTSCKTSFLLLTKPLSFFLSTQREVKRFVIDVIPVPNHQHLFNMREESNHEESSFFHSIDESLSPPVRRHRVSEKVIFEYPPNDFKERIFADLKVLKDTLRTVPGALRANFRFSSNSNYITARCKVPSC